MSVFSSVITAIEVGWEQSHAVPIGLRALRETSNPIIAMRAYAKAAGDALEQAVADDVEEGLLWLLGQVETAVVALESVSRLAGDVGYTAGQAKNVIRGWVAAANP